MSPVRVAFALLWVHGAVSCADDAVRGRDPSVGGQTGTGGASLDASSGGQGGAGGMGGGAGAAGAGASGPALRVMLFSKTTGFRHDSIPASVTALAEQGAKRGWQVGATEDSVALVAGLPSTDVVVFLNTSGDVLDASQQSAFQSWLATGRGWLGVHAASDTEYEWPWYGDLVGAWFLQHPSIQNAKLRVERQRHLATEGLPSEWSRSDEWYAFKTNPRANVQVVLSLDEKSYDPGAAPMGDHPVAWYHGFGGGRAFYTALGHTIESWSEPAFLAHVSGGIEWAGGREHPQSIVEEFDGAHQNGLWAAHAHPTGFAFEVAPGQLTMHDKGDGVNQHVVRRGVTVDASRPYVIEALFTISAVDPFATNMNSFALNLNVSGADGDFAPPSTWSANIDLPTTAPGGVMKYMGFQAGSFAQLGERTIDWGVRGTEYLLRVGVGVDQAGSPAPKKVTTTVTERGVVREHYDVDYSAFPYQPELSKPVRLGANTHATDWILRGLRAFYAD